VPGDWRGDARDSRSDATRAARADRRPRKDVRHRRCSSIRPRFENERRWLTFDLLLGPSHRRSPQCPLPALGGCP
jgi:hypothetical protein